MTDANLSAQLAILATESPNFRDGARILDHSDALTAILDEIDATVLPAALEFDNGTSALHLLATSRRLHRIIKGAADDVLDQPLNPDDAELTARAAQVLADFAQGATSLQVTHAAPPAEVSDMSDRVSVQVLKKTLDLDGDDPDAPPCDRFCRRIEKVMQAALHLENRALTKTTGSGPDVMGLKIALTSQMSSFVDQRVETCASHRDPSLTLLVDVLAPGVTLGLAVFDTRAVLFSMATADISKATTAFTRVV